MNHSYHKVLCHLLVTLHSLPLLKSYEIPELLNLVSRQTPCPFPRRLQRTSVLIQGVEFGFVNVPLHNIYLSSDLVSGPVAVGIRPSLPFKGIHWLLGNDLAGDKVVVNPLLTNIPCEDQLPDLNEQETLHVLLQRLWPRKLN